MSFSDYIYDGTRHFDIAKVSRDETKLCKDKNEAAAKMAENEKKLDELQQKLYAEKKEGLIIIFQAMDAAGKDGTITHVLQCLSPHGVYEAAFKAPSAVELAHDYLWRVAREVPAKGEIAIFNRSQYEDVLIGSVRELYKTQAHADRIKDADVINNRLKDIRHFEEYLYHNSVRTIKIFLNVSKDEQAERFLARIDEPEKNWKFSSGDVEERKYWDKYMDAFETAVNATATKENPWYVVPADHKWYMRYVVSEIILKTLQEMKPEYPVVTDERRADFAALRESLLKELPAEKAEKYLSKKD